MNKYRKKTAIFLKEKATFRNCIIPLLLILACLVLANHFIALQKITTIAQDEKNIVEQRIKSMNVSESKEIDSLFKMELRNSYETYQSKIDAQMDLFFNSNTITFIVSFILILMISMAVDLPDKVRKENEKMKDSYIGMKEEFDDFKKETEANLSNALITDNLAELLQSLFLESLFFNFSLKNSGIGFDYKKYRISPELAELVYQMNKKNEDINKLLENCKGYQIEIDKQAKLSEVIIDTARNIDIKKIKVNNSEDISLYENLVDDLIELKTKINSLETKPLKKKTVDVV